MIVAIYALWWENPGLVYIGQSNNVLRRYLEHKNSLIKNHHCNYKVQNAYNKYGSPELIILQECSVKELNSLEVSWTKEFSSLTNGLNIVEPGEVGWGTNANASKYSRNQVLKVFSLLYRGILTYEEISTRIKIPVHIIADIKRGKTHTWLYLEYPEKYSKMQHKSIVRYTVSRAYPDKVCIVSPEGEILEVTSIVEFCKVYSDKFGNLHNSISGIGRIISGNRKSYLGWKLYKI